MGQYRHTITNIRLMPHDVLMQKTVVLSFHQEKRFHYFLDLPSNPKFRVRLNIVGHSASSMSGDILFSGACSNNYNPGMNLRDFCETITALLTELKKKGENIQSVRIVGCNSGKSNLAQELANHLDMPVKGALGGTRMYPTTYFRPEYNMTRNFIDKFGDGRDYSQEEQDRLLRHDPYYGVYQWYYPDIEVIFNQFVDERNKK
ncbi:hypothetical protein J8V57_09915 [Xenorhabdus sp. PB61.4]|uniref:hypothetical protein n=1 Tax=Xenorhabdus sp. PB61.4 TaxID=2788940 RepID=UPI001E5028CA|nr:hypothetical protein [Xenorhabdus sp. PB61.4]MCC8366597.1 hypothetical protein [Xenorhabdus sp. PB61.4]